MNLAAMAKNGTFSTVGSFLDVKDILNLKVDFSPAGWDDYVDARIKQLHYARGYKLLSPFEVIVQGLSPLSTNPSEFCFLTQHSCILQDMVPIGVARNISQPYVETDYSLPSFEECTYT
jgi:hypothetical protein